VILDKTNGTESLGCIIAIAVNRYGCWECRRDNLQFLIQLILGKRVLSQDLNLFPGDDPVEVVEFASFVVALKAMVSHTRPLLDK